MYNIKGKIKRWISRIFMGDIVADPEQYIKKIVDILNKDYHEYWYKSGFDWHSPFSTKENYYGLTQPWSKIKNDEYFIRDTFDKQFVTSEIKDDDRFLCIKYKEPAYFGFVALYNYAVIPIVFNDKDIMLLPFRSHKFKDDEHMSEVFVETEEEIKEILIEPVIKSLEKAAKPTVFRELTRGEVAYIDGMCGK